MCVGHEIVGTVAAVNPEGTAVGYTLTSASAPFELNAVTGEITTTEVLDRETAASYTLAIEATDGTTSTDFTVAVEVSDVNEAPAAGAPPTFAWRRADGAVGLAPWPYAADRVVVEAEVYPLRQLTFGTDAALARALQRARPTPRRWTLVASDGPVDAG